MVTIAKRRSLFTDVCSGVYRCVHWRVPACTAICGCVRECTGVNRCALLLSAVEFLPSASDADSFMIGWHFFKILFNFLRALWHLKHILISS